MSKIIILHRLETKVDEEKYGCLHKYYQLNISKSDEEEYLDDITNEFVKAFVVFDPSDGFNNWKELLKEWNNLSETQKYHYTSFFQEGFIDEMGNLDKTNEIGIYGEMIMYLYINEEIKPLLFSPKTPKKSVDTQSDFITIEGDINDINSLYIKIWECKSSDEENTQSTKVYTQLSKRPRRLSGSISKMLFVDNNIDENTNLGRFLCKIPSIILNKTEQYRCNAFFVFGSMPKARVLKEFREKVSDLHSSKSRNVNLIFIPDFKMNRNKLWKNLKVVN